MGPGPNYSCLLTGASGRCSGLGAHPAPPPDRPQSAAVRRRLIVCSKASSQLPRSWTGPGLGTGSRVYPGPGAVIPGVPGPANTRDPGYTRDASMPGLPGNVYPLPGYTRVWVFLWSRVQGTRAYLGPCVHLGRAVAGHGAVKLGDQLVAGRRTCPRRGDI